MYSIEDPAGNSKFCGCGAQVCTVSQHMTFSKACHSSKVCSDMQVMGPDKAYLVQHTDNTRIFWADKHELVLGACFKGKTGAVPRGLLDGVKQKVFMPVQFLQVTSFIEMLLDCIHRNKCANHCRLEACHAHNNTQYRHFGPTDQNVCFVQDRFGKLVDQGYQATLTWHQGKSSGPHVCMWSSSDTATEVRQWLVCLGSLESDDSSAAGDLRPTVKSIKWAYSTRPVYGWGNSGADQKSTAGWLAALPVFEPHWQVHSSSSSSATFKPCQHLRIGMSNQ